MFSKLFIVDKYIKMARKQFYNIKYPFVDNEQEGYMFDLAKNRLEQAKSEVMHLVLTPKGQRIRKPGFGSDLIKFVYEMNDDLSWSAVETEIRESAEKWLSGISIKRVEILQDKEYPMDLSVRVTYSVDLGYKVVEETTDYKI